MGAIWLGSLPDVLRGAGLTVKLYPGWETRSRSSGGYDSLLGIQEHHTASSGFDPLGEMAFMWDRASSKPIGACYVELGGVWWVGAAGATNTSGRGGPLVTSRGVIPVDAANRHVISIEAANPGDGTPWPVAQQESLVAGTAALNAAYFEGRLREVGDVHGHFEWTSRKIDPSGSSRYAVGAAKWDMHLFRSDVAHRLALPPGDDDMVVLDEPIRMFDSRKWPKAKMEARRVYDFGVPSSIPANATSLTVTVTAVEPDKNGFLTLWSGRSGNAVPTASKLNWQAGVNAIANSTTVAIHNRNFKVYCHSATHLVVDIDGYS